MPVLKNKLQIKIEPENHDIDTTMTEMEERQFMLRIERLAQLEGLREERKKFRIPSSVTASINSRAMEADILRKDGTSILEGPLTFRKIGNEPRDPDEGCAVIWMSDGIGAGDKGDIMMKITSEGVTKTIVIVDYNEA